MLYRHFLAPGALSPAARTCDGDNTGQNKDGQFLDVGSINPKYLDTQQWGTLCATVKALGQEFWESEVNVQIPNQIKPNQIKPNHHPTTLCSNNFMSILTIHSKPTQPNHFRCINITEKKLVQLRWLRRK